jgi:hypothetical protein
MPIGDPDKDLESAKRFEHIYTHWIKTAVEDLNLAPELGRIGCHRADKEVRPGDIIAQVIEALSEADIVIADLTGRNPNVFYELGVRHALRNNTLLIAQDLEDIPFDLRGQRAICYRYDPESLISLKRQLQASLSEMISATTQIDNPVRRFLYEREVAKLVAAPVPPGYDALRQLLNEMHVVRQDLAERVIEIRELVQHTTSTREPPAVLASEELSVFEGAWTSTEDGGLYVVKRTGPELRGPYCFGSDRELTAHFFNVQIVGEQLLCRFKWFGQPIEGCVILRPVGEDRLVGGWWYIDRLPAKARTDLQRVHEKLPGMNPLHLVRVPMPEPMPSWATDYFNRAIAGEV